MNVIFFNNSNTDSTRKTNFPGLEPSEEIWNYALLYEVVKPYVSPLTGHQGDARLTDYTFKGWEDLPNDSDEDSQGEEDIQATVDSLLWQVLQEDVIETSPEIQPIPPSSPHAIARQVQQLNPCRSIAPSYSQRQESLAEVLEQKMSQEPSVWVPWILQGQFYALDEEAQDDGWWSDMGFSREDLRQHLFSETLCRDICSKLTLYPQIAPVVDRWFRKLALCSVKQAQQLFATLKLVLSMQALTLPVEEMILLSSPLPFPRLTWSFEHPSLPLPKTRLSQEDLGDKETIGDYEYFAEVLLSGSWSLAAMTSPQAHLVLEAFDTLGLSKEILLKRLEIELSLGKEAFIKDAILGFQALVYTAEGSHLFEILLNAWTHSTPGCFKSPRLLELAAWCLANIDPQEVSTAKLLIFASCLRELDAESMGVAVQLFSHLPRLGIEATTPQLYSDLLMLWIQTSDPQSDELAIACLLAWYQQNKSLDLSNEVKTWCYEQAKKLCLIEDSRAVTILSCITGHHPLPSPLHLHDWRQAFPIPSEKGAWLLVSYAVTLEDSLRLVPLQYLFGQWKWQLKPGPLARVVANLMVQLLADIENSKKKGWLAILQGPWVPKEYQPIFNSWVKEQTPWIVPAPQPPRSELEEQIQELQQALQREDLDAAIVAWKNYRILHPKEDKSSNIRQMTQVLGEQLLAQKRWQTFIEIALFSEKQPTLNKQQEVAKKMLEKLVAMRSQSAYDAWFWALTKNLLPQERFSLGWQIAHLCLVEDSPTARQKARKLWEQVEKDTKPQKADLLAFFIDAILRLDVEHKKFWIDALCRQKFEHSALPKLQQALEDLGHHHLADTFFWLDKLMQDRTWHPLLSDVTKSLVLQAASKNQWPVAINWLKTWWGRLDPKAQQDLRSDISLYFKESSHLEWDTFLQLANVLLPSWRGESLVGWLDQLALFVQQSPTHLLAFLQKYREKFVSQEDRLSFDKHVMEIAKRGALERDPQALAQLLYECPHPFQGSVRRHLYFIEEKLVLASLTEAFSQDPPASVPLAVWNKMIESVKKLWYAVPDDLKDFELKSSYLNFKMQFIQDHRDLIEEFVLIFNSIEDTEEKQQLTKTWDRLSNMSAAFIQDQQDIELLMKADRLVVGERTTAAPWVLYLCSQERVLWERCEPNILSHLPLDRAFVLVLTAKFLSDLKEIDTTVGLRWAEAIRNLHHAVGTNRPQPSHPEGYETYLRLLGYLYLNQLHEKHPEHALEVLSELQDLLSEDLVTRRVIYLLNESVSIYVNWICQQPESEYKEHWKTRFLDLANDKLFPFMARRYAETDTTPDEVITFNCAIKPTDTKTDIRRDSRAFIIELFLLHRSEAPFIISLAVSYLSAVVKTPNMPTSDLLDELSVTSCLFWYLSRSPQACQALYLQEVNQWNQIWDHLDRMDRPLSDDEKDHLLAWKLLRVYLEHGKELEKSVSISSDEKLVSSVGYILKTAFKVFRGGVGNLEAACNFLEAYANRLRQSCREHQHLYLLNNTWRKRIYRDLALQRVVIAYIFAQRAGHDLIYDEVAYRLHQSFFRMEDHFKKMSTFAARQHYYMAHISHEAQKDTTRVASERFYSVKEITSFLLLAEDRLKVIARGCQLVEHETFVTNVIEWLVNTIRRTLLLLTDLLLETPIKKELELSPYDWADCIKKAGTILSLIGAVFKDHPVPFIKVVIRDQDNIAMIQKMFQEIFKLLSSLQGLAKHQPIYKQLLEIHKILQDFQKDLTPTELVK